MPFNGKLFCDYAALINVSLFQRVRHNSFFSIFHSSALSTPAFATRFTLFFFILRFLPLFSLFVINYINPLPSLARRCERKCLHRLHEKTLCSGVRFFPLTPIFQFPTCTSFFFFSLVWRVCKSVVCKK